MEVDIPLGTQKFLVQQTRVEIVVSGSAHVKLPDGWPFRSAPDLLKQTETGAPWIITHDGFAVILQADHSITTQSRTPVASLVKSSKVRDA